MLRKLACLTFSILLFTAAAAASPYIAVTVPELQGAAVVAADLEGQGEILLVGRGREVFLLDQEGSRELLQHLPGDVSALAVGDINGDFRPDLVIGTERSGAIYFFTERSGFWQRQEQAQYLWESISRLEVHDFNSDGWGDVVAVTERGEAFVYLSHEGSLQPLWRSPAGDRVVGLEVADVDLNGYPDLVYALSSGRIAILTWTAEEEFATMWENYPWGQVESLVLLPHAASPEWLVVTSQKMLYAWRWRSGEAAATRLFEANALGEQLFYVPGQGLLSFSKTNGLSLFELQSSSIKELWRVPGIYGTSAFYYGGQLFFRDENQVYYRLAAGSDQWRVFVHRMEVTDQVELLNHGGQLYFSLEDLAPHLGFELSWDGKWKAALVQGEVILEPASTVAHFRGLPVPLSSPVMELEGRLFAAHDLFPILGWIVELDAVKQQVILVKNWGWWF